MPEPVSSMCLQPILRNLEAIQVELGKAQLALLDLLADSEGTDCEDARRSALIRLESIQRGVGEVQIMLFREVSGGDPALAEIDAPSELAVTPTPPSVVPHGPVKPAEPSVVTTAVSPDSPPAPKTPLISPPGQRSGSLPSVSDSAPKSTATNLQPVSTGSSSVSGAPPRIASLAARPTEKPLDAVSGSMPVSGASAVAEANPPAGSRTYLETWLDARGCRITELRKPTGMDAAADEIALFLGQHYADLEMAYAALRGLLNPRRTNKWIQTDDWPPAVISQAVQFGRKLKDNGFLAQFVYVSKNKTMLCEPVSDPRVLNFLDGGWLERWAAHVMKTAISRQMGGWQDERLLQGVQIELPNHTEAELDVLANPAGDTVVWIECKAGNWQSDLHHYYELNQQHFHLPAPQAALVLVDRVKEAGRASAGELSSMTVLHLTELNDWLGGLL